MSRKLKIVHIASEVAPFSKTGGLGDVVRSLPKAQKRLGHEVMVITPLYGKLIDKKEWNLTPVFEDVKVFINSSEVIKVNYYKGYLMEGLPIYFVDYPEFFSKKKYYYGFKNENARFLAFSVASLKLLSLLKNPVNIIHCHDWQTGLIPYYLKTDFRYSKTLKKAKSIFTIHNLIFQLGHNWWEIPLENKDYGRSRIPHMDDKRVETINFAKRAILSADMINTVSERYRLEIMTKKFGQDLHRILKNREDRLYGIINGIDYYTYNPLKDPGLRTNYLADDSASAKRDNKLYLQEKVGLPRDEDVPVICTTSRVTFQKGFDLILSILEELLKFDIQLVFMGDGNDEYIKPIKKIAKKYPNKMIWMPFEQDMETLLYAGSDLFLLPSNHEPCGINQLIAMRYGCIPIVREIGGLHDTVENYNPGNKKGNGFTFKEENSYLFFATIIRALENFDFKITWRSLVKKVMKQSNSWEIPANKYIELYRKALKDK
ncbi:MAG: glycogen/starch synthase [Patescibacteria group bacterium]|jgi:starch synthase|nr:glycogen/starch synthase [Patescibacteria group bacterium]